MEYKSEPEDVSSVESGNDLTALINRLNIQKRELDAKARKSCGAKSQASITESRSPESGNSVLSNEDCGSRSENAYLASAEGMTSVHYLLGAINHLASQFQILTDEVKKDRILMDVARFKIEQGENYRDALNENQFNVLEMRSTQLKEYFEVATARMQKIEDIIKHVATQPAVRQSVATVPRADAALVNSGSSNKVTVSGNSVVTLTPSVTVNPSQHGNNQTTVANYIDPVSINCVLCAGNVINASGNSNVTIAPVVHINVPSSAFCITSTVGPDGSTRTTITPVSDGSLVDLVENGFVSHVPITVGSNSVVRRAYY